ncbi:hypothetical protein D1B31_04790 [Neobacillus notoginsengisoli]|uniref:Uncharacterized protein n=1 Tax=Neobacillus notoginsengisoli TaxID=1578198 RepID=A0A417YWM9_9BACI|nr:hypothetical protein [Neobacillus notoginsengisoli]RHW41966.1 hypothetical protein D1B31_04790 [Neobacillus notoginsengisoli]
MKIPNELDGAKVIQYTNNVPSNDYGIVLYEEESTKKEVKITGIAIAKYEDAEGFNLFSCDLNWQVIGDYFYFTLVEAINEACDGFGVKSNDWCLVDKQS